MKRSFAFAVALCAVCAGGIAAESLNETDPDVLRKVRRLIDGSLDSNEETQKKAAGDLREMGNLATPALVTLVRKKDTAGPALNALVIALGDSKDPRAAGALLELLNADNPPLRRMAARALGQSANKDALKPLEEIAAAPANDEELRLIAAIACAKLKSEKAPELLRTLSTSKDPGNRARAVFALGKYSPAGQELKTVAALKPFFADLEDNVREECVNALRLVGGKASAAALIELLGEPNFKIRNSAMDALRELTQKKFANDPKEWKDWWEAEGKNPVIDFKFRRKKNDTSF